MVVRLESAIFSYKSKAVLQNDRWNFYIFVQIPVEIGYTFSFEDCLEENGFVANKRGELSTKAVLLFGKRPQRFFERARIRFIRFDGNEELNGPDMNVIKDVEFNGRLLDQLNDSVNFVKTQVKERTFLGQDGRFVTIPEYPEFCWKELIVNAVTHRDYSIVGTDIQIKMFDDRFTVESPGNFAGNVTEKNIRNTHFSRNRAIAAYMKEHKFVKEFGEGVKRIYREMYEAGLPEPTFSKQDFMTVATLKNATVTHNVTHDVTHDVTHETDMEKIIRLIKENPNVTREHLAQAIGKSTRTVQRLINACDRISYEGSGNNGRWIIKE